LTSATSYPPIRNTDQIEGKTVETVSGQHAHPHAKELPREV